MLSDDVLSTRECDASIENAFYEDEEIDAFSFERMEFSRVHFTRCKFQRCVFARAGFYDCIFEDCDISYSVFSDSYWRRCTLNAVKGVNADLHVAILRETVLNDCSLRCLNLTGAKLESVTFNRCMLMDSFFNELKTKQLKLNDCDLTRVDFFKTPLKGLDLSTCRISGIALSDDLHEIAGAKISSAQAVDIAVMLGVKIV